MARPNVLLFIPHDLGDHLHCYGHPTVRSPHLDDLAGKGVRFTNHFTTCPECTSSRGSLFAGLSPHRNGLMGLAGFGWELFPGVSHLARRLADGGYDTHLFGFQHETSGDPQRLGYAHVHRGTNIQAGTVCHGLARFIREAGSSGDAPWFACAGFSHVHRPWNNTSTFAAEEVDVPPYLPDNPIIRDDLTHFHQDILEMDEAIGGVLGELRASDAYENTLVIFTTDHGIGFPHAKATLYDPGLHIPLIMHWPGRFEGGRAHGQLLSNVDFTPTLLECCGLPSAEDLEGRSFLPLLEGRPYAERNAVFSSLFYDVSYDPMHSVRTRSHKYIRSFAVTAEDAEGADPRVLSTFAAGIWIRVDDADVMSREAWRSLDVDCSRPPREELYDLSADPLEMNNLASDPTRVPLLREMRERMHRMMVDTESPLLDGHVPPPDRQVELGQHYREQLGIA